MSDPLLTALAYAAGAAAASALGALPFLRKRVLPPSWLGWASALAAGLMLGLAYTILVALPPNRAPALAGGAALGVLLVAAVARLSAAPSAPAEADAPAMGRLLLSGAVHAAHEGVAIGVATAVDLRFGAFMAIAIAVHNVPEAAVLVAGLRQRGVRLGEAAGLAVTANASQVALAAATLALTVPAPGLTPWMAGLAVGALIHLVMTELLPDSYHHAGRTSIALVAVAAMGAVVLARGGLP